MLDRLQQWASHNFPLPLLGRVGPPVTGFHPSLTQLAPNSFQRARSNQSTAKCQEGSSVQTVVTKGAVPGTAALLERVRVQIAGVEDRKRRLS